MSEITPNSALSPDVATLFSTLLSNLETLSKISGILSKYKSEEIENNSPPDVQNDKETEETVAEVDTNDADLPKESPTEQVFKNNENAFDFSKIASLFGGGIDSKKSQNKEQIALLLAIKPYLSPRRNELIDSFIKITNFSEILKNINQQGDSDVLQ